MMVPPAWAMLFSVDLIRNVPVDGVISRVLHPRSVEVAEEQVHVESPADNRRRRPTSHRAAARSP